MVGIRVEGERWDGVTWISAKGLWQVDGEVRVSV